MAADVVRLDERRTTHAEGLARWRDEADALRWWARDREHRSSARGVVLDPNREPGSNPNRAAEDPRWARRAAIAYALKLAADEDRKAHPGRPAPLERWLLLRARGRGRSLGFSLEQLADDTPGWTAYEVRRRMRAALRVIRERLAERGLFEVDD
jgi:hypothetical protein